MFSLAQASEIIAEHAQAATEAGHQVAEHAEHAANHGVSHAVNWVTLLAQALGDTFFARMLINGEKIIFALIVIALIAFFCFKVNENRQIIPGRLQSFLEGIVVMLDDLVCSIIGPQGRAYTPFVGSLFMYILASNLYGLFPLQNSATGYATTTAALALAVFFYVQLVGITKNGFLGYIAHLAGNPVNLFGYFLIPINLPLHVLGEFTKPLGLTFRLFGNVMAGHILVAVFLGMGVQALKPLGSPIGLPLHFPFLFLEILVGIIQAFVFALLSTIYIGMMLPHEHEHSHEPPAEHLHEAAHGSAI